LVIILWSPGLINPAAPKVVKRILDFDFVAMSEVAVDDDLPQNPDCPPAPVTVNTS